MRHEFAPVFVYGALRWGTTMFRLMLNSHPGITNPGEADFLFDHLIPDPAHPTGWRYDRDGLAAGRVFRAHGLRLNPDLDGLDLMADMIAQFRDRTPQSVLTLNVHRHADRIAAAIPGVRVIHMLRDPRDVARSCVGMGWVGNSYHGVHPWIETERDWDRAAALIGPEQVLTLPFEQLMADLDNQLGQVCDFLGVPLTPEMLRYHENSTYTRPDAAIAQQWRRKASPREVSLIEGRCADLMTARGYAPEIGPRQPGSAERIALRLENRLKRWRYNIDRFGLPLFLAGHLTRLPGLGRLRADVRQRMEQKVIASLK